MEPMEGRKRNVEAYRKAAARPDPPVSGEKQTPPSPTRPAAARGPAGSAGPPSPVVDGLLKITGRETSVRKAAKFLMLIGRDEAGKVLRHFTEPEIEAITREIAGIRRIEAAEAEKLLAEFGFLKETLR